MKTEFMTFVAAHPFITALITLLGGYGAYRLANKAIDSATSTANNAIDARYTFELSGGAFKAGPQRAQPNC